MPILITHTDQQIDPTKLLFTLAELIEFSGVSRKEVDGWLKQKFILPTYRGKHRKFTFLNVFEAAIAKIFSPISNKMFPLSAIKEIRKRFFTNFKMKIDGKVVDSNKLLPRIKFRSISSAFNEIIAFDIDSNLTGFESADDRVAIFSFCNLKLSKNSRKTKFWSSIYISTFSLFHYARSQIRIDQASDKAGEVDRGLEVQLLVNISKVYRHIVFRIWKYIYHGTGSDMLAYSPKEALSPSLKEPNKCTLVQKKIDAALKNCRKDPSKIAETIARTFQQHSIYRMYDLDDMN